ADLAPAMIAAASSAETPSGGCQFPRRPRHLSASGLTERALSPRHDSTIERWPVTATCVMASLQLWDGPHCTHRAFRPLGADRATRQIRALAAARSGYSANPCPGRGSR